MEKRHAKENILDARTENLRLIKKREEKRINHH